MEKTVVIGDIHGRNCWQEIIEKERPTLTIFLGDYVSTHEGISEAEQLENLNAILDFKEQHPDQVVLLRGNHDTEAAGFQWAMCSPSFKSKAMFPRERFERLSLWAFVSENVLFSHAGVSNSFLKGTGLTIDQLTELKTFDDPRFAFTPDNVYDFCGESLSQPPTWIRPLWLLKDMPEKYTQVVGHTVQMAVNSMTDPRGNELWLCDALGAGCYLCIDDTGIKGKRIKM